MKLLYSLRLYSNNELIHKFTTSKRGRVPIRLKDYAFDQCYLKVTYGSDDLINEGWYSSVEDAMEALNAFCVPELLDYIASPRKIED